MEPLTADELGEQLTWKQKKWADFYLVHLNATQAAEDAKYKGGRKTLAQMGYENLRKPEIRAYLDARMEEVTMTKPEILFRLHDHATGDLSEYWEIDDQGQAQLDLKALLEAGKGHLIKEYEVKNSRDARGRPVQRIKVKSYDAQSALDKLARARAMYGPQGSKDDPIHHKHDIAGVQFNSPYSESADVQRPDSDNVVS